VKRLSKMISFALTIAIFAFVAAGCISGLAGGERTVRGIDISEEVHLYGYLLAPEAPMGMPAVMEELNRRLKEDLNCTMEVIEIGGDQFTIKYPQVLAAGEQVDWVYAGRWAGSPQEAAKGAFYDLTEEMIAKYMPLHYAALDSSAWNSVKVGGKIFMVPALPIQNCDLVLVRKDLREKYGVAPAARLSDLGPYLEAIKQNEPAMIPIMLSARETGSMHDGLVQEGGFGPIALAGGDNYSVVANWDDTSNSYQYYLDEPFLSIFKDASVTMKSWYDSGYINRDVFANDILSKDSFLEGKSGLAITNVINGDAVLQACAANGIGVEFFLVLTPKGTRVAPDLAHNGFALSAFTKNPERALMAMDLLIQDPSYNFLVYFGIEGVNYALTPDGNLTLPEGMTADQNTYPPDASGFWFTNAYQFPPSELWSPEYAALRANMNKISAMHPLAGFVFDQEAVKTEYANIMQIQQQYLAPIRAGMVSDVDAAIQELDAQLKAAGVDKLFEEVTRQAGAFLAALN